jgi:hypothetical protein
MKKVMLFLSALFAGLLGVASTSANFLVDTATDVGSGASDTAGDLLSSPVGDIIYIVVALAVIGFIVSVIMAWMGRRKNG